MIANILYFLLQNITAQCAICIVFLMWNLHGKGIDFPTAVFPQVRAESLSIQSVVIKVFGCS